MKPFVEDAVWVKRNRIRFVISHPEFVFFAGVLWKMAKKMIVYHLVRPSIVAVLEVVSVSRKVRDAKYWMTWVNDFWAKQPLPTRMNTTAYLPTAPAYSPCPPTSYCLLAVYLVLLYVVYWLKSGLLWTFLGFPSFSFCWESPRSWVFSSPFFSLLSSSLLLFFVLRGV